MIQGLEDFKTYNKAMELDESVWAIVAAWAYFEKDTVRKQLVSACDSIAANLSEGLGRYHSKEVKNFTFYARGSAFETKTWPTKAANRKLIAAEASIELIRKTDEIARMINGYIQSLNNQVNEPETQYRSMGLTLNT
ncbi:MAG: four helix bundle protein [Cyclobacteriaceae bacterium]|jgi:four helix bundle protein|nr:four helix bundle protein [Cyclobacteriaceae bacterium]